MAFEKGKSGNASGRPPGIVDQRAKWRDALEEPMPEILEMLKCKALDGDVKAAKILVDKGIANAKSGQVRVLIDAAPDATLADKAEAINAAVLLGKVEVDQGLALLRNLEIEGRIQASADIDPRLERLESHIARIAEAAPHLLAGLE